MAFAHNIINHRHVVKHMEDDLCELKNLLEHYLEIDALEDLDEAKKLLNLAYGSISSYYKSWSSYLRTYNLSYEKDFEETIRKSNEALSKNIEDSIRKDEELRKLKDQLKEIQNKVDTLLIENGRLKEQIRGVNVIDYISEKAEHLARSEAFMIRQTRQHPKGDKHVKYRQDVKIDDLVADYQSEGYKLTYKIIQKYGMTYQGLKVRLVEAGVWRGFNKKGGEG